MDSFFGKYEESQKDILSKVTEAENNEDGQSSNGQKQTQIEKSYFGLFSKRDSDLETKPDQKKMIIFQSIPPPEEPKSEDMKEEVE